jgi:hypothetical protein
MKERKELCWAVIGRITRGVTPTLIIFLDKKFKILINIYFLIQLKNYPIVLLMAQQDIEIS